jgi:capsular exopolysaccharide synthesis family protein
MRPGLDDTLVSLRTPSSFAAEQYQALRLQVERLRAVREVRAMGVSSPGLGDGKTVTAINLAAAHAESERVLLIDADLRRPSIGSQLRLTDVSGPGLADALSDERLELTHLVRHVDDIPFAVILAGVPGRRSLGEGGPSAPVHELLRSPRLDQLLQDARRQFDLVIVDTPPLLPVTDPVVLARALDGIVVVVAANNTPRKLLEESLNLLDSSKVLGIVFNKDHRPLYGYYSGDYRTRFTKQPARSPGA